MAVTLSLSWYIGYAQKMMSTACKRSKHGKNSYSVNLSAFVVIKTHICTDHLTLTIKLNKRHIVITKSRLVISNDFSWRFKPVMILSYFVTVGSSIELNLISRTLNKKCVVRTSLLRMSLSSNSFQALKLVLISLRGSFRFLHQYWLFVSIFETNLRVYNIPSGHD